MNLPDCSTRSRRWSGFVLLVLACSAPFPAPFPAQGGDRVRHAPDRTEGEGSFERLIIRGVTMIDGTDAPPRGPVDIVIEGNRIADIVGVGVPGGP